MRKINGASALALAAALLVGAPGTAFAKDAPKTEATEKAPAIPPELLALEKSLHPQSGDVHIPGANAALHLGDRYYYLPPDEAKKVLVEVWRNPPDAVDDTLGMVLEKGQTIFQNVWGAVITYKDTGHVSDEDANTQDYSKVLSDMQQGEAENNEARKKQGYPTMSLVGWAQAPSYDKASHSLIWARELANEGEPEHGLNYDVRLLGRTGVLSLNMVSGMNSLADVRTAAQQFGKSVTFEPGSTYADFNASTDKAAEYGLAGLVAGGGALVVAQKLGLFALILKFGKLIILGLVGAGAAVMGFIRKMFGKQKDPDVI